MTSYRAPVATAVDARPRGLAARSVLTLFSLAVLAGLVLGAVVGWLWVALSDPPRARLFSNGGIYLGEVALNQQAGVTMWFIVLGAAAGAIAGLVVGFFGVRFGWLTVVAVLALCAVGNIVSRYAGVSVFGADPHAEAVNAQTGDLVQLGVQVDTWIAYLGWPIGGVLGALAGIAGWSRHESTSTWPTLDPFAPQISESTTGTDHDRQHTSSGEPGRV